jgi:hypothetical protein
MIARRAEGPRRPKSRYFLVAACLALAVTFVGFFKTFILPSTRGTFSAPTVIYVHGGFLFLWAALFFAQSLLIQKRKVKLHRRLGFLSLGLIPGVVISTMATGVYVMKRDLAAGDGEMAVSSLVGSFTTPIIFATLAAAGIVYRRRIELHKEADAARHDRDNLAGILPVPALLSPGREPGVRFRSRSP